MAVTRCLLFVLPLASGSEASEFHPLAFDFPRGPDDSGSVPEEFQLQYGKANHTLSDFLKAPPSLNPCNATPTFGKLLYVYQMHFQGDYAHGLRDRNAANIFGLLVLLHGRSPTASGQKWGVSRGWALRRYYSSSRAWMARTYVSYTWMGNYESCNAVQPGKPGSHHTCSMCTKNSTDCCCAVPPAQPNSTEVAATWPTMPPWMPTLPPPPSRYPLIGMLKTVYTGGPWYNRGVWYSFNGKGEGHTWQQRVCPDKIVRVQSVVNAVAKAGGCSCHPDDCKCQSQDAVKCKAEKMPKCDACAECLERMELAKVTQAWNHAFSGSLDEDALQEALESDRRVGDVVV